MIPREISDCLVLFRERMLGRRVRRAESRAVHASDNAESTTFGSRRFSHCDSELSFLDGGGALSSVGEGLVYLVAAMFRGFGRSAARSLVRRI